MFYEAIQKERYFNRDSLYPEINWNCIKSVVDAFGQRISDWYCEPVRRLLQQEDGGHFAFTAMALNCLLIDTLSQYEHGLTESNGEKFKEFVRDHLKPYSGPLKAPIRYERYDSRSGRMRMRRHQRIEDVLWAGFRCGILHEAHAALYGSVRPDGQRVSQIKKGHLRYTDTNAHCVSVVINPWRLFSDVEREMKRYLKKLKNRNSAHDPLRDKFRRKFSDSFGVDISAASF